MLTNAGFVALSQVVAKVTTLVWTVVAAQMLGQEGFGGFNFALATATVLATFVEWGFNSLLVQRSSVDRSALSRHFSETLTWQFMIAIGLLGLSILAYGFYNPDLSMVLSFALIQIAVLCDTTSSSARAAASVLHRQVETSLALVAQRVIAAGVIVAALLGSATLLTLSAAFAFASVAGVVLQLIVIRRMKIIPSAKHISRRGLRAFATGSNRIGISVLLGSVLFRVGFITVGAFWGDAEVGAYAAAYKLFDTVLFLSYALVAAAFPSMSEAAGSERLKKLTEGAFGLLAVVYVPYAVVSFILAPDLVALIFGKDYVPGATTALRLLALAPLLFGINYVGGTSLVSMTRTQGVLVSSVVATIVSIGLSVVLVPPLGADGAALALVLALVTEAAIVVWFLRDALGSWPKLINQVTQPVIACCFIAPMLILLELHVAIELGLAVVVYLVVWLALASWRPPAWLTLTGHARLPWAQRRRRG